MVDHEPSARRRDASFPWSYYVFAGGPPGRRLGRHSCMYVCNINKKRLAFSCLAPPGQRHYTRAIQPSTPHPTRTRAGWIRKYKKGVFIFLSNKATGGLCVNSRLKCEFTSRRARARRARAGRAQRAVTPAPWPARAGGIRQTFCVCVWLSRSAPIHYLHNFVNVV